MSPINDGQASTADQLTKLKKNVDFWTDLVKRHREQIEAADQQNSEEQKEFNALDDFLKGPLINRLMGVYQENNEFKDRYLKSLEPFFNQEGLQNFIEHHFDVELDPVEDLLIYRKKEVFEKEMGTLFMLFKVKKTIETIITLQKATESEDPFASSFSKEVQQDYLNVLKEILKLFFIKFVKKEYLKSVYSKLSEKQFQATGLANRREKEINYIRDKILEGTEVRSFYILLFFTREMRTLRKNKIINIAFNYLDFELIKNEFLVDWLQRKLKGNALKDQIYAKHRIGNQSLKELIGKNPEKEGEILQKVPLEEFNDIAEQINEIVDEEDKTPVPTFSKNHGEMARSESMFGKAKKLVRLPLKKMKQLLIKKKKTTHPKSAFSLQVVSEYDIDFAFFDEMTNSYANKLTFLRKKMGEIMNDSFRDNLWTFFEFISSDHLIKREEPVKEWAIPFLLKNGNEARLLIVGAEISQKKTKSGVKFSNYEFTPYFVYGLNKKDDDYGRLLGTRTADATEFFCYSYAEERVQKEAMQFFQYITIQRQNPVFTYSSVNFKIQKDRVKTEELIQADE